MSAGIPRVCIAFCRQRLAFMLLLGIVLAAVPAFAQRDLGTITGTITDAQGAAVPGAKVVITEAATGLTYDATTDEAGTYSRPLLKPGSYTVDVEAPGFQRAEQKDVIVNASERTAVNMTLQIGNAQQTVEVTAAAPLLQTESAQQGANLNTAEVSQLPLGGQRTFTYLARLSPGVLTAEPGARGAQGGDFSANGVRSTGENNFLLNGVDNNVNVIDFINQTSYVIGPSVDAIGEMQILTNGYNAEYGRAAGGVVDVQLKSGTNSIHGDLFEFLQNTQLDANRWENNLAGVPRDKLIQNQFGGTMGGPIIKNKLFIFGDYQGTRIATAGGVIQNLGYGGFYTIPTQQMVQGNFSELLGKQIGTDAAGNPILQGQLYDPASTKCISGCNTDNPQYTRTPFAGNIIPQNRMDPAAMKIAALYPATNQAIPSGIYPSNDFYTVTPG